MNQNNEEDEEHRTPGEALRRAEQHYRDEHEVTKPVSKRNLLGCIIACVLLFLIAAMFFWLVNII